MKWEDEGELQLQNSQDAARPNECCCGGGGGVVGGGGQGCGCLLATEDGVLQSSIPWELLYDTDWLVGYVGDDKRLRVTGEHSALTLLRELAIAYITFDMQAGEPTSSGTVFRPFT